MKTYDHQKIEKKWQKDWDKKGIYKAESPSSRAKLTTGRLKRKFYALIEFPYPSGVGLHVGHVRSNTAMDIISRKRRMEGYNVLYPIGWDAFGLPTENYAIKTGIPPAKVTKQNTDTFRRQLKSFGFSFDWSREVNTTDPKYYKWTQWIFLQMFKKGLAYKKKTVINWCPSCKIGLANEEVIDGKCERCGAETVKKEKEQWMLAITKYADRLDKDLDSVDYLEKIKIGQRNWIGRSEGSEIRFKIKVERLKGENSKLKSTNLNLPTGLEVFTTRADTLFGATYVVLAPEHELVTKLFGNISNKNEIENYIKQIKNKTDIDRTAEDKEKTGVELKGVKAINPANGEEIPVWIADYVLAQYGTGAVMAVPAHDERDFEFAKKYNLPIIQSIVPMIEDTKNPWIPGKKIVERNVAHVILRHPDGKVLLLYWKYEQKWEKKLPITFLIGGIEPGEDLISGAKREIKEETGFINVKFKKQLLLSTQSRFFAAHKDENRIANVTCLIFDLIDDKRVDVNEEEKNLHDWKFVSMDTAAKEINIPDDLYYVNEITNPKAYTGDGLLINSGKFDKMTSDEARRKITEAVGGKMVTKYKLRDWIFSRQRYWGEPIPIIHCEKCGYVPVPDKELPLALPKVKSYTPTDNGESPLATITKWVNVKCPKCKGRALRETDTMPNWAGSSWYYLRYTDTKNNKEFASRKNLKYWTPVDWYNGGMEHVTLHLLYSRFWHKFLYDLKLVPTKEPYKKRTAHGMILAEDGEKMSKSRGNVINPDDIIKLYGADTLRLYEMFIGPFDQTVVWNTESIIGSRRFLEKVWRLGQRIASQKIDLKGPRISSPNSFGKLGQTISNQHFATLLHKTIKKVSEDIESMSFNTAVSSMMVLANEMEKQTIDKNDFRKFLIILSTFAPHITEELWSLMGEKQSINVSKWPIWDEKKIIEEEIKIAIQVNGKVRAEIMISKDTKEDEVRNLALKNKSIITWIENKEIKRVIYVAGRVINIVV